jgi:septum formation protein
MPRRPDLVLASTSRYRASLLERLGLAFRVVAPGVDEEALREPSLAPAQLAAALARAKTLSVAEREPDATVIGGDQIAVVDGRVLGKPGTAECAVEQLLALCGREHDLVTAIAVRHAGELHEHTDLTALRMRRLERAEIERYVAADAPLDCAGAYKLESRGIALFEAIRSEDHTAITGLPLIALTSILRGLGFPVP